MAVRAVNLEAVQVLVQAGANVSAVIGIQVTSSWRATSSSYSTKELKWASTVMDFAYLTRDNIQAGVYPSSVTDPSAETQAYLRQRSKEATSSAKFLGQLNKDSIWNARKEQGNLAALKIFGSQTRNGVSAGMKVGLETWNTEWGEYKDHRKWEKEKQRVMQPPAPPIEQKTTTSTTTTTTTSQPTTTPSTGTGPVPANIAASGGPNPRVLRNMQLKNRQRFSHKIENEPVLCSHNDDRVVLAWSDSGFYGNIHLMISTDGQYWIQGVSSHTEMTDAHYSPGLAFDTTTGTTFLGWMSSGRSLIIMQSSSPSLEDWAGKQSTTMTKKQKTLSGISIVFVRPYLFVAWLGNDWHIYVRSSTDGGASWVKEARLEEGFHGTPRLGASPTGRITLTYCNRDDRIVRQTCLDLTNLVFGPAEAVLFGGVTSTAPCLSFGPDGSEWWAFRAGTKRLQTTVSVAGQLQSRTWADEEASSAVAICPFRGEAIMAWKGRKGAKALEVGVVGFSG
ncbi:hypothetical protein NLU13_2213 [Sarocladium strictum]|uniref:Uncharacterized protein n=1 Tax=Sarocladium strictum TaxID=5046 RepID=A0AA39LCY5_SARSR|nr:hypothetical protein NLU13_2213 [Sarocladium strictum]